jgi:hypothetical protein
MRQGVLILLLIAASPGTADAQSTERGSVSGLIGAGRTWDDEGNIGGGVAAGGRVDWRVFGTTRLEVSADVLTHDRTPEPVGAFGAEGTTTFVGVSLIKRFGRSEVQPYVLGGLDLVRHSGTTTFDQRETERKSTDWGVHGGGGVAFQIGSRVEVGPEARLYLIQPEDSSAPARAYWIGVRIAIRF